MHAKNGAAKFSDDPTKYTKMLTAQMKDINLQLEGLHKIKVKLEKDIQKNELTFK